MALSINSNSPSTHKPTTCLDLPSHHHATQPQDRPAYARSPPRIESHLGVSYVKNGQDILEEDVTEDVRPRSAGGDGRGAVPRPRIHEVLEYHISRVDPKVDPRDVDGKVWRD